MSKRGTDLENTGERRTGVIAGGVRKGKNV